MPNLSKGLPEQLIKDASRKGRCRRARFVILSLLISSSFAVLVRSDQRSAVQEVAIAIKMTSNCMRRCAQHAKALRLMRPVASLPLHPLSFNSVTAPFASRRQLHQRWRIHSGAVAKEDQPVRNPIDTGSRVLVVGATRGIGVEFVQQCLEKGASVIATHRGSTVPSTLVELSAAKPGQLSTLELDVTDPKSIERAAKTMEGQLPITHIIHNAGVYGQQVSIAGKAWGTRPAAAPITRDIMLEVFATNAVGPLLVVQSFYPFLAQPPRQSVMAFLTSKVGSIDDNSSGGAYAYRASKIALNMIAKSLSVDLAGKASVLLLHPGYVKTDMTGGKGLIDADESVAGMLRAIEATDATSNLRWVDYKAELVPW